MTYSSNFVFSIDAFDSIVLVQCGDSEIFEMMNRYVLPQVARLSPTPSSQDIFLEIDKDAAGFRVMLDRRYVASVISLNGAVLAAVKALDDAIVHRMRNYCAVHAGAVLIEGRALLLPGTSHAGKSSLVAELLRRGASCFSDEYALVDNEGQIHSYPRPLLLRDGRPRQSLVLPEELNASFAQTAALGWIFVLDYAPGETWQVREITQGEAILSLLRNTPHEMTGSPQLLDVFLRAIGDAHCYSGRRGEAAQAAELILQLVGASPSKVSPRGY